MNAIDYFMITYNLRNGRIQITSDYMKKCNRLQITITPCLQHIYYEKSIKIKWQSQHDQKISFYV
jgi:hypothetical protein